MKRKHQRRRRRLGLSKQTIKQLTDRQQESAVGGKVVSVQTLCPTAQPEDPSLGCGP
jgi:hypothetical protein